MTLRKINMATRFSDFNLTNYLTFGLFGFSVIFTVVFILLLSLIGRLYGLVPFSLIDNRTIIVSAIIFVTGFFIGIAFGRIFRSFSKFSLIWLVCTVVFAVSLSVAISMTLIFTDNIPFTSSNSITISTFAITGGLFGSAVYRFERSGKS